MGGEGRRVKEVARAAMNRAEASCSSKASAAATSAWTSARNRGPREPLLKIPCFFFTSDDGCSEGEGKVQSRTRSTSEKRKP